MIGIGTINNPWDLGTALDNPTTLIHPGDTILLRGGTYAGPYSSALNGTAAKPISFRAYPGERAIIDGSFTVAGAHTHWIGLEFADLNRPNRDTNNGTTVVINGEGTKLINCLIHDKDQGVAGGGNVDDYEIYGCLIFYNGWDTHLGHGVYTQHGSQNGRAALRNNMVFDNFGYGLHIYGSQSLDNFTIERNTVFNSGDIRSARQTNILMGGIGGFVNPEIHYNRVYYEGTGAGRGMQVGRGPNTHTGARVTNNLVVGGGLAFLFDQCVPDAFNGNAIYGSTRGFEQGDWPGNTYSTYAAHPDAAILEPNAYDRDRAHLTVYNPSEARAVQVDVSAAFDVGDSITARNVQDYWVDTQELTVAGAGTITVDMQAVNRSVGDPVGRTAPSTTFPRFAAMVLERTA